MSCAAPEILDKVFLGVRFPDWLRVFDCRREREQVFSDPTPWGERIYCRAAYALGLLNGWTGNKDRHVSRIQFYFDARELENREETVKVLKDLAKTAEEILKDYKNAEKRKAAPGQGGGVYYRPIAVALSNYGASVIADSESAVVKSFD